MRIWCAHPRGIPVWRIFASDPHSSLLGSFKTTPRCQQPLHSGKLEAHSYEHRSHPSKTEILFSSTFIKEKAEASQDKDRHLLRRVLGHLGGHKAARQRQTHETVVGDPAPWKLHAAGHTLPTQVGSQEVLERHSTAFPCHPHRYAPATGEV